MRWSIKEDIIEDEEIIPNSLCLALAVFIGENCRGSLEGISTPNFKIIAPSNNVRVFVTKTSSYIKKKTKMENSLLRVSTLNFCIEIAPMFKSIQFYKNTARKLFGDNWTLSL